jgi:hypothetical protein
MMKSTDKNPTQKKLKNSQKTGMWIMIIGTFLNFIVIGFSLYLSWGKEVNIIGETLASMTAPLVGLLASILVYLSFLQQYYANRELRNAQNEQKIRMDEQMLNEIRSNNHNYISNMFPNVYKTIHEFNFLNQNGTIGLKTLLMKLKTGPVRTIYNGKVDYYNLVYDGIINLREIYSALIQTYDLIKSEKLSAEQRINLKKQYYIIFNGYLSKLKELSIYYDDFYKKLQKQGYNEYMTEPLQQVMMQAKSYKAITHDIYATIYSKV